VYEGLKMSHYLSGTSIVRLTSLTVRSGICCRILTDP